MRKVILSFIFTGAIGLFSMAQDVSVRVAQVSHSVTDPDGAGPATGSVVIGYQLQISAGSVLADGIPFSMVYQSSRLMPSPTNTTVKVGPLASAATTWTQNVDNRAGNAVAVNYGGQPFDRRMIVSFVEPGGNPNVPVTTTNTAYVEITYWTLGSTFPQGGYITPEPGSIVPQNELSSDGGLTTFPYLSPALGTPVALGTSTLPVTFSSFDARCTEKGAIVKWSTASEQNSKQFDIQRSADGNTWRTIGSVAAAGNSNDTRSYNYLDLEGGSALYRIRQVDFDNRSMLSAISRTTGCKTSDFNVVLYPVPTRDNLTVVIRSDKDLRTDLQIIDMKGSVLRRVPTQINKGNNTFNLVVSELPAGQYMLRSADAGVVVDKKFVITR
jgi:hypothetical protein